MKVVAAGLSIALRSSEQVRPASDGPVLYQDLLLTLQAHATFYGIRQRIEQQLETVHGRREPFPGRVAELFDQELELRRERDEL